MTDHPEAPRTEAGRAAWARADGLGPKLDMLTLTAREYRESILAIEREAAAPPEPPNGTAQPLDVAPAYQPIIKALTYPCREPMHRAAAEALARLEAPR